MDIRSYIRGVLLKEHEKMDHEAPDKKSGYPLYDLTDAYGDDIYSSDALRLYGVDHGNNSSSESIWVIKSARNKPNKPIRIYRAVPDINWEVSDKIKKLNKILDYRRKFGFFPIKEKLIHDLDDKYSIDNYEYREQQRLVKRDIENQIEELSGQLKNKLTINNGDWVTLSRAYAKMHGISHLNNKYKIVSKVVKASELFTDANDVNEWGYDA